MATIKANPVLKLMIRWIAANFIAWPLGVLLAIILSHLVVNIFHPEETNLIVGLCVAFSIGFAQWLIIKRLVRTTFLWFVVPSIGIGLPYGLMIMQVEAGNDLPLLLDTEGIFMAVILFICGAIVGLIQSQLIFINRFKPYLWILLSGLSWSISITLNSFLFSGLIIGLVTLSVFILPLRNKEIVFESSPDRNVPDS